MTTCRGLIAALLLSGIALLPQEVAADPPTTVTAGKLTFVSSQASAVSYHIVDLETGQVTGGEIDPNVPVYHVETSARFAAVSSGTDLTLAGSAPADAGWSLFISEGNAEPHTTLSRTLGADQIFVAFERVGAGVGVGTFVPDNGDLDLYLGESSRVAENSRVSLHQLNLVEDGWLTLGSGALVQLVSGRTWRVSPPSLSSGERSSGLVSSTAVRVNEGLALVAVDLGAEVQIIDHSDGDDSVTLSLAQGDAVVWTAADLLPRPQLVLADPFDDDVVELRASAPVLVFVGAFEGGVPWGVSVHSAPVAPGVHVALVSARPGYLTATAAAALPMTLTAVAGGSWAPALPDAGGWVGSGPVAARSELIAEETLLLVTAAEPFSLFTQPTGTGEPGGYYVPRAAPLGPELAPVARAGADLVVCPGQVFTLDGGQSFDPDLMGVEPALVEARWDLDLGRDADGDGISDDDIDSIGSSVSVRYLSAGVRQVRLWVVDNEGAEDWDDVQVTVVVSLDERCGGDGDLDGVADPYDNCPSLANATQLDLDRDGVGDLCDDDDDGDGVRDATDLCPRLADSAQLDLDGDGLGDACDPDRDGDGTLDPVDGCPDVATAEQGDIDGDGLGDACDADIDGDGRPNAGDNCPLDSNVFQTDTDRDGQGDACDGDDDADGVPDSADNCPQLANPDQRDGDGNAVGDACELDADGDGVADARDNCPQIPNPLQTDLDSDGRGNFCDQDLDGDGYDNLNDNCMFRFNPDQNDADANGFGDLCEPDADGDGVLDFDDNCLGEPNPDQHDLDQDGRGDFCDQDMDGDGLSNVAESQHGTAEDRADTDHDGLNDGLEVHLGTDPLLRDSDGDGLRDGEEYDNKLDPLSADSDRDGVADGAEPGWNEDSDSDGLINARDSDADDGGVEDGAEVRAGTDMLDPTDDFPREDPPLRSQTSGSACGCATLQKLPLTPLGARWHWWLVALGFVAVVRTRRPW